MWMQSLTICVEQGVEKAITPAVAHTSVPKRRISPLFPSHPGTSTMVNVKQKVTKLRTTKIFFRYDVTNHFCSFKFDRVNVLFLTNCSLFPKVRDCRLVSLLDLAMEKDYVRGKVAEYMNTLIDMGVAGFRVDACKHMWPGDLSAVFDRLHNLSTKWFSSGSKPFIYQEVTNFSKSHRNSVMEMEAKAVWFYVRWFNVEKYSDQ